ncbi:MAG: exodeoxyribonuclease VII large subunit [Rickettsiales bacterium]
MSESAQDFNHNQPVYSIGEVSGAIKRLLEDHFGEIRLRGEVSGWRGAHSSGHAYFSLKDDKATINAVCWRGTLAKLQHKPEEGLEVIATGRISAYNGRYQLVITHIEPAGEGALMALLEKRRKQLQKEGLFDEDRKQPLPFLPRKIGVVTSPTGAVIRDILHRLSDRFPIEVLVWPVAVQGEGAAEQIAAAIDGFNSLNEKPDVLIVARGGGSIEDLWCFNEEIVVRAAANSSIPLISAVGHETDTTLIDFASDRRAPTPTAAAEMAVPVRDELLQGVRELEMRMRSVATRLFENATQKLDDWSERLQNALPALLERKSQQLALLASNLQPRIFFADIKNAQEKLVDAGERMIKALNHQLEKREEKLKHLSALMESVNYKRVLERGFALVRNPEGKVISSAEDATKEEQMEITFKDGSVVAKPG